MQGCFFVRMRRRTDWSDSQHAVEPLSLPVPHLPKLDTHSVGEIVGASLIVGRELGAGIGSLVGSGVGAEVSHAHPVSDGQLVRH